MKNFIQEYGLALFEIIAIIILVAMASPVSKTIQTAMNDTVTTFNEIVVGDNVNNDGFIGNVDSSMDKILDINQIPNHTEDGDVNSGNDTNGKNDGDLGDLGLH